MKENHVALFLPSLEVGGAERVMVNLAKGFVSLGKVVDVVLVKAKGPFLKELPKEVNLFDLNSSCTSLSILRLRRYLREECPDVFISTLNTTNIASLITKLTSKVSTRFLIREASTTSIHLSRSSKLKTKALIFLVKALYNYADGIVAVSQGVADDLICNFNINKNKIRVISNPIFVPDRKDKPAEIEHIFFQEQQCPVVLGVGRLEEPKNFRLLIHAFARLKKKVNCRLIILGEGSERAQLEQLVKELRLESSVSLPGFSSDPYTYMWNSTVFVLSSLWEGFPNSLVEALACGCPVVSTNCQSGPAEILNNGEYGLLVPVNDIEKMESAILASLSFQHDKQHLVRRAQEFSLEKTVRKYLES